MYPTRGIAAGASGAVFELAITLALVIERFLGAHPRCQASVHVDDVCLAVSEPDPREAVRANTLG